MTIANKYNQLKEGKVTNKQFLEFVRKEPNLKGVITPMQSFYDTIIVLKNKRFITEGFQDPKVDKAVRSAMAELEGKEDLTDELISDVADKWSEYYDLSFEDAATVATTLNNNLGGGEGSDLNEDESDDELTDDGIDDKLNIDKNSSLDEYTDEIQQILRDKGLEDYDIAELFDSYGKSIENSFKMGTSPHGAINLIIKLNQGISKQIGDDLNESEEKDIDSYKEETASEIEQEFGWSPVNALRLVNQYPKLIAKSYKEKIDTPWDLAHTLHQLNKDRSQRGGMSTDSKGVPLDPENQKLRDQTGIKQNYASYLNEGYDNVDKERFKIDNLNPNQIADGTKVEFLKQKTKDKQKARQLAIKNLLKDPIYYTNLLAGHKEKKKRTDLPIELDKKFTNTIDKANGTKDVPGVEKDKASANKANKETQKVPTYKEDTFKAQRAKGIKGVMDMPGKEKKIKLSEVQKLAKAIQIALKESFKK